MAMDQLSGEILSVESENVKFGISAENGCYYFLDKQSNVVWGSNPYADRMGEAVIKLGDTTKKIPLRDFVAQQKENSIRLSCRYQEGEVSAEIVIRIELLPDGRTAEISYQTHRGTEIQEIRLLDESLWVTDAEI